MNGLQSRPSKTRALKLLILSRRAIAGRAPASKPRAQTFISPDLECTEQQPYLQALDWAPIADIEGASGVVGKILKLPENSNATIC